jgi:hypothetical protein
MTPTTEILRQRAILHRRRLLTIRLAKLGFILALLTPQLVIGAQIPTLPSALIARTNPPSGDVITLGWNASPDATVTGYKVYYSTNAAATNLVWKHAGSTSNTSLTISNQFWPRYYAATAHDAAGMESDYSRWIRVVGKTNWGSTVNERSVDMKTWTPHPATNFAFTGELGFFRIKIKNNSGFTVQNQP